MLDKGQKLLKIPIKGQKEDKNSKIKKANRLRNKRLALSSVPTIDLFSNQFLADLEKIWELRKILPDPSKCATINRDRT